MKHRIDRQRNQQIITQALGAYCNATGTLPTQKKLAELTGFSTRTIRRHDKDTWNIKISDRSRALILYFMDHITMALINSAIKGNMKAIRLCMIIAFDYDPYRPKKMMQTHSL